MNELQCWLGYFTRVNVEKKKKLKFPILTQKIYDYTSYFIRFPICGYGGFSSDVYALNNSKLMHASFTEWLVSSNNS